MHTLYGHLWILTFGESVYGCSDNVYLVSVSVAAAAAEPAVTVGSFAPLVH